jgi:hypothetical protein
MNRKRALKGVLVLVALLFSAGVYPLVSLSGNRISWSFLAAGSA